MKVATHLIFAECCGFATSAIFNVHYETPSVLIAAATSVLPDADYPKSWIGHQLGSISEDLHRFFGHRSFLHSFLALVLVTVVLGLPLWWIFGHSAVIVAVFVGYGSHLLADMMTLGGVQLFWPSRAIAVLPGRDEYRVVSYLCLALLSRLTSRFRRSDLPHGRLGPALRRGDQSERR
jgi:inner membrane protein